MGSRAAAYGDGLGAANAAFKRGGRGGDGGVSAGAEGGLEGISQPYTVIKKYWVLFFKINNVYLFIYTNVYKK
jgi:hypothetical protein